MAARFQVWVKDHSGTRVGVLAMEPAVRLEYTKRVNAPDNHVLTLIAQTAMGELLHEDTSTDYQIEVYRSDVEAGIPWYMDYEGFHRTSVHAIAETGRQRVTSYGNGYDYLLGGRSILYPAGSAGAEKTGPGETVMKEYVDENAGPGATAPPRLFDGVTPGFTVQADGAAGSSWTGARAYRDLMATVQEIAHATLVDFKVVGISAALFEFRAKAYPWGEDRSTQGLDPVTGLNAAGNVPVIFSVPFGNLRNFTHTHNHTEEGNAIIVLGQGLEDDRLVIERPDAVAVALTPWNRREAVRNANLESTQAGLEAVGDTLLHDLMAIESFNFQTLQSPSTRYGRNYFLGDIVTVQHANELHFQIIGVTVTVENGRETITLEVQEDDDES